MSIPNSYDFGLTESKAIYRPFPHSGPNTHTIEKLGISPCRNACPAKVNNHAFIELYKDGRLKEALDVLRDSAPFQRVLGLICHHPCETECVAEVDMKQLRPGMRIPIRTLSRSKASEDT